VVEAGHFMRRSYTNYRKGEVDLDHDTPEKSIASYLHGLPIESHVHPRVIHVIVVEFVDGPL